jgi:hypothetical protein
LGGEFDNMRIEKRLDLLKEEVQKEDFLKKKGLGNEIAFWIFDYPPEKELLIRDTILKLLVTLEKNSIHVLNVDLYELCLEILEKKISFDKIIDREKKKGSNDLLSKLQPMLRPEILGNAVFQKLRHEKIDMVFLTGVGKAWPLARSHLVLNNLQSVVTRVPLVMFYPGKYSGLNLNLFGRFEDNNYYRAFRLINGNHSEGVEE